MNPVVTARVPEGVRSRGIDVLREIGSSTSELVNAAFEYVIKERRLPKPDAHAAGTTARRKPSESQLEQLNSFMDGIRISVPESWDNTPFEELLDEAMEDQHASIR